MNFKQFLAQSGMIVVFVFVVVAAFLIAPQFATAGNMISLGLQVSSIGIVVGAGWNGARAFTATSGPGVSLMTEFIGLAYFAEIPAVIVDVQRGGPSTGMPTRTQQSDLLACAYASHGDTKHVVLLPANMKECFEFGWKALDLAQQHQIHG